MSAYLTRAELAPLLKVSVYTVGRMTRRKEIPYITVGRQYRYDLEAVEQALAPKPEPVATWQQSARSRARKRVA